MLIICISEVTLVFPVWILY